MPAKRRWLAAGAVLSGCLLAAEFLLRLGLGLGDPPLMQADGRIGYLFAPNQSVRRFGNEVSINAHHQRSPPVAPLPAPGTLRILIVGDSVTFGGVQADQNETYPSLLRQALADAGIRAEVLNASAGSWAIGNEAAYIERFGTFASRIVVLQIGSHDLVQRTSDGSVVGSDVNYPDRKPSSALSELVGRYLLPRLSGAATGDRVTEPADEGGRWGQFGENMAHLRRAVGTAGTGGARVIVLHTPGRPEVSAADPPFTAYEPFRAAFREVVAGLDVGMIDLAAEWRHRPDVERYYRDATHPAVPGNRAIAERLRDAVIGEPPAPAHPAAAAHGAATPVSAGKP